MKNRKKPRTPRTTETLADNLVDALAEFVERIEATDEKRTYVLYHRIPRPRPKQPDWSQKVVVVYVPPEEEMPK